MFTDAMYISTKRCTPSPPKIIERPRRITAKNTKRPAQLWEKRDTKPRKTCQENENQTAKTSTTTKSPLEDSARVKRTENIDLRDDLTESLNRINIASPHNISSSVQTSGPVPGDSSPQLEVEQQVDNSCDILPPPSIAFKGVLVRLFEWSFHQP